MAEVFSGLVKQLVIFLLAARALLYLGIGRQYERYVKLVISLMILSQLIVGIMGFFVSGSSLSLFAGGEGAGSFEERFQRELEDFEQELNKQQEEIEAQWAEREGRDAAVAEKTLEEEKNIIIEEIVIP